MTLTAPSPFAALRATARGTASRVLQGRGWLLAALALAPVGITVLTFSILRLRGIDVDPGAPIQVFHEVIAKMMLPIMALVAAPAGIREDLEQRTLPLMLVRPAAAWTYPLGKGLPWALWGAGWLALAVLGLQLAGGDPSQLGGRLLAVTAAWWGELALLTLVGLFFKRGTLWGALYFFLWEPFVTLFPPFLQRLTFLHHIESLSGSRAVTVKAHELLAQVQVSTPPALSLLALLAFGALCWALAGWKLHRTPVGLAGSEAEG